MMGRILTGAAIGVGAVALAPFTGGGSVLGAASLAASLTGAGALAAGAGVTGAATAYMTKGKKDEAPEESAVAESAVSKLELEQLEEKLVSALERLKSVDNHFKAIIALEAVGVACAACDGDFSDQEKEEIGEFVKGMMSQTIPEDVKSKIQSIYDNPPTIKEAYLLAKDSGVDVALFEEIIQFVMRIDGITYEEQMFAQAWSQMMAA